MWSGQPGGRRGACCPLGNPAVEVTAAAARLDPLLGNERLTTEGLTDVIYGQIFREPHVDQEVFRIVREVAETAGTGLTGAVSAAAKEAVRSGFTGVRVRLARGVSMQVNWDRPSVYVELLRGEAFVVLRVENHPSRKGRKFAWIHEIQAPPRRPSISWSHFLPRGGRWRWNST
jgi:hypothetical protein